MRPAAKAGRFTFAADVADQRVRVVVNALDEDDAYLDFLSIRGSAVGPELTSVDFGMEQVAPGRYVGEFPAAKAGSYFVSLSPGLPEMAPILCGVNVPSSNEFRDRTVNEFLLGRLRETVPKEGQPGVLVDAGADSEAAASLATVDSFRREGLPKAIHSRDVWHEIVFCVGCLFFFDVFLRRVTVGFGWLVPLAGRVRTWAFGGSVPVSQPATIARLRGRKADIAGDIERLQMATRFGPSPEPGSTEIPRQEPTAASPLADADVPPPPLAEDASPDETYTERLLRAKHNVWD